MIPAFVSLGLLICMIFAYLAGMGHPVTGPLALGYRTPSTDPLSVECTPSSRPRGWRGSWWPDLAPSSAMEAGSPACAQAEQTSNALRRPGRTLAGWHRCAHAQRPAAVLCGHPSGGARPGNSPRKASRTAGSFVRLMRIYFLQCFVAGARIGKLLGA